MVGTEFGFGDVWDAVNDLRESGPFDGEDGDVLAHYRQSVTDAVMTGSAFQDLADHFGSEGNAVIGDEAVFWARILLESTSVHVVLHGEAGAESRVRAPQEFSSPLQAQKWALEQVGTEITEGKITGFSLAVKPHGLHPEILFDYEPRVDDEDE